MATKDTLLSALTNVKKAPGDLAKDRNFLGAAAALQKVIEGGDDRYRAQLSTMQKVVAGLKKSAKGKKDAEKYLDDLEKELKADEKNRLGFGKDTSTDPS